MDQIRLKIGLATIPYLLITYTLISICAVVTSSSKLGSEQNIFTKPQIRRLTFADGPEWLYYDFTCGLTFSWSLRIGSSDAWVRILPSPVPVKLPTFEWKSFLFLHLAHPTVNMHSTTNRDYFRAVLPIVTLYLQTWLRTECFIYIYIYIYMRCNLDNRRSTTCLVYMSCNFRITVLNNDWSVSLWWWREFRLWFSP